MPSLTFNFCHIIDYIFVFLEGKKYHFIIKTQHNKFKFLASWSLTHFQIRYWKKSSPI